MDQHTDRVTALRRGQHTRRRADTTLESIAAHSSTAADRAFQDRARPGVIKRLESVGRFHVLAVRIVHEIKRLSDDGIGENKLAAGL